MSIRVSSCFFTDSVSICVSEGIFISVGRGGVSKRDDDDDGEGEEETFVDVEVLMVDVDGMKREFVFMKNDKRMKIDWMKIKLK